VPLGPGVVSGNGKAAAGKLSRKGLSMKINIMQEYAVFF
jgi:hypothetical protein